LLSLGLISEQLGRRRDARRFPPLGKLIDVGGHRLQLLSDGVEGPTVVIEQGACGSSLSWRPLQKQPEVVLEAIRSVVARARQNARLTAA
jgi:hypothetical protein